MSAAELTARVLQAVEELEEELVEFLRELAPQGEGLPRTSVLGRFPGRWERPCLHLTGHYDVVPAGDGWSVDPYAAELRGGRVYGRGAADQKSGIAAQLFALKALLASGCRLAASLVLSATPDEETGGFAGLGYLVQQGLIARDNTDFVVITECLDVDRICLGHRGTLWLELETRGRQSHGSMPTLGVNAIEKMLAVLGRIEAEVRPGLLLESSHPIKPEAWARGALEGLRDRMRREDPELDLHIREIMSVEPTLVPRDTEVVRAFQEAGLERCIVYGPGPLEVAHQADEFQPVADLKQATAVLALAALRLLGEEARG